MKEYFRVEEDMLNNPNQYEAYLYLFRFWYSKRQELRGLVKSQLFSSFISAWNAHSPAVLQPFFKEQMDMQLFGTGCKRKSQSSQKSLQTIFSRL